MLQIQKLKLHIYIWCGFKSRRGKNKNLTALKSNSNTVWFNFQTYIIFSINLVSFKVTLRSSGTDILYGCHLLLDVYIYIYIYIYIYKCLYFSINHCNTRRVPLMEQKQPTLPEHTNQLPLFRVVRVVRSLVFWVVSCRSLFVLFLLAIVLSLLLRFTDSDYPFGISKLYLKIIIRQLTLYIVTG